MSQDRTDSGGVAVEQSSPRAAFADLVAGALEATGARPTPMATAYLVELLAEHVREPAACASESTLAEALLSAHLGKCTEQAAHLRAVGDRALFVSGLFGDSLMRSLADLDYYRAIGCAAYGSLSASLSDRIGEHSWSELFEELADGFGEFVDILTAVGDRTRCPAQPDLLRLYERYVRTGSEQARTRLLQLGFDPTLQPGVWSWQ